MTGGQWPQRGDRAVELTQAIAHGRPDTVGDEVTVTDVTETLVITSDGGRYNRERLHPITEGRYSRRVLVAPGDERALVAHGRRMLREVAKVATNSAALDHRRVTDVVAAFGALARLVGDKDAEMAQLVRDARRDGAR